MNYPYIQDDFGIDHTILVSTLPNEKIVVVSDKHGEFIPISIDWWNGYISQWMNRAKMALKHFGCEDKFDFQLCYDAAIANYCRMYFRNYICKN